MSQFHFLEEDADSPKSSPPGTPPTPPGASQPEVSPSAAPISSASPPSPPPPAISSAPKSGEDYDPFDLTPDSEPPAVSTPPVPTPAIPTPVTPVAKVATPQVPTPPAPVSPVQTQAQSQTQSGAAPKPLQPRTPQGGTAPGTPQARATPKAPTPAVPTPTVPTPAVPMAVAAVAETAVTTDAEAVAQTPTNDSSSKLYQVGREIETVLDTMEGPASWVIRIAFPIAVLCLAFMLATVFSGSVAAAASNGARTKELVTNLSTAGNIFKWTFVISAIAALLAGYQDNRLGAIVAALGGLFFFGAPLGLKAIAGEGPASGAIAVGLQKTGMVLLVLGLIKASLDLMAFLWTLPDRIKSSTASIGANRPIEAAQRLRAREANMFSPCWNLPFCREAIRKMCPAFLARTTCWKFKRGCYCDEEMIARIVRGDNLESIKAPTKISQSRQPPCSRCYIYLEHQTYKFRMLSPLALPASIAISYALWPIYGKFFLAFEKTTGSLWRSLSFSSASLTPDAIKASADAQAAMQANQISPQDIALYSQWIFGLLIGFFLLIYLSKFIEWAIFKAKW